MSLMILTQRDYPGLSGEGPKSNPKGINEREAEGDQTHRNEDVTMVEVGAR